MKSLLEITNLFKKSNVMNWKTASPIHPKNRGIPTPSKKFNTSCEGCNICVEVCPTKAIQLESPQVLHIDYGACLQCGECVSHCPENKLQNSGFIYVFSKHRDLLKATYKDGELIPKKELPNTKNHDDFEKLTFKNGFLYREVAAAGNNTVECELNASYNSVFDSEREGVRCVASPKHADAVVYSGPISGKMAGPLADALAVISEPKALIACGTEAVSGGLYQMGTIPKDPDLYIAGDPPRPDASIQAFRYLMGRFPFSFQEALHKFLSSEK